MDYLNISNAEGDWEQKISDYGVNTLLLSPAEQPALCAAVQISDEWVTRYQDASAIIFERK
jgi:hypothetical protein